MIHAVDFVLDCLFSPDAPRAKQANLGVNALEHINPAHSFHASHSFFADAASAHVHWLSCETQPCDAPLPPMMQPPPAQFNCVALRVVKPTGAGEGDRGGTHVVVDFAAQLKTAPICVLAAGRGGVMTHPAGLVRSEIVDTVT